MTDDLISRQAAIELCDWHEHEFSECDYAIKALADDLKSLPAAEPTQRWIPVAERLPEDAEDVIATTSDGDVRTGWYNAKKGWCVNDNYWPNAFDFVAWMPLALPDPYKEEEDEN